MERRGFLGRLLGGIAAVGGVMGLAPKKAETTWLINTDYLKYTGPNAGRFDKIMFKGCEIVEDDYEPKYYFAQVHGHTTRVTELIEKEQERASRTMVAALGKELFRNA